MQNRPPTRQRDLGASVLGECKSVDVDPWDPVKRLRTIDLFADLDAEAIEKLADQAEVVHVGGGETVVRQGDEADGLYVVHVGRLRVTVDRGTGHEEFVDLTGPGGVVGEMAVISDEPHSATVTATRDSTLVRISGPVFAALVASQPEALRRVAAQVVERHRTALVGRPTAPPQSTIAVLAATGDPASRWGARAVAEALASIRRGATVIDHRTAVAVLGTDVVADPVDHHGAMASWHGTLEAGSGQVVLMCNDDHRAWAVWCAHQADLVVVVCSAVGSAQPSALELEATEGRRSLETRVELVLVHPDSRPEPSGTAQWLNRRDVDGHHHVRDRQDDDARRAARLLGDGGVALVLSGGGARGVAHIGVVRAAHELGVPIDAVGGTSIGSLIGAAVARGWSWPQIEQDARAGLATGRGIIDPTLPVLSLASGRRMTDRLRRAGGGLELEDLLIDYFCVSTNLSARRAQVHDRGPGWRAVRASLAIPGLFPPVPDGDDVLVDGGLLDNYPVAAMRQRHPGATVIGVDVGTKRVLSADGLSDTCDAPPSRTLRDLWRRRGNQTGATLPKLLAALTELGQAPPDEVTQADVTVRPEVGQIPILGFDRFDEIVDLGYRAGMEVLRPWSACQGFSPNPDR